MPYLPLMRCALCLFLLATPALSWEFTDSPICTLSDTGAIDTKVTYDGALYAIHLTRAEGWPDAPVFSLRFDGAAPLTISTARHQVSGDTLSVTDSGFGNVLNGLQFNSVAYAHLGALTVPILLDGAAEPVEAFRSCKGIPLA